MARPQAPIGDHGALTVSCEHRDPTSGAWVSGKPSSKRTPVRHIARTRVRGVDGTLRQVRATAATTGEARSKLQAKIRESTTPSGGAITRTTRVADLASAWLAQVVDGGKVQPGTVDVYRRSVRVHLAPRMADLRVGEVSVPVVDRVLGEVLDQHGHGSAKTARTCLGRMLHLAVTHGALAGNPVRDASPLRRHHPQEQARALTTEQAQALTAHLAADPRAVATGDADLVRFMLGTGCRIGEALALRWERVDLSPGSACVQIRSTVDRVTGQATTTKEQTKTRAGQRTIPIHPGVASMLGERREAQVEDPRGLVFPTSTGTVADPSNVTTRLKRLFTAAGFPGLHSHDLRKTRATRLLDAGVPLREVSDLLGHSDMTMTLRAYVGRNMGGRGSALVE